MQFVDPNIARKNAFQDAHLTKAGTQPDGSPVFSEVEFNITGLCNRTCVFCPRVDPTIFPNVNKHLPLDLYAKILKDLENIDYSGRISYSGFGEPLLHPKLLDLVQATRGALPKCWLDIVSNGDKLSSDVITSLFDAGLTTLLISMYDGPEQIEYFNEMISEAGLSTDNVILRPRYLPAEEGYGINLTNRAGMVSISNVGVTSLSSPMSHPCYYTHYRMMIDYTGEVLLCPHDWGKKLIVGDLHNESITEVWSSSTLTNVRKRLAEADRGFSPCNNCDVLGTRQGKEHAKAWQEFYGKDTASN